MLPTKAIIKFGWLLLCTIIVGQICIAQQNLRLKDVAKIDLIKKGPAAYGGYEKNELKFIGGRWQIYRTFESKDNFDKGRSEWIYIGDAATSDLRKLVKIINKGDTGLNIKSFHINKNILVKYIDSISRRSKLPEGERSAFIRFYGRTIACKRL